MTIGAVLNEVSLFARFALLIGLAPLVAGIAYAIKPSEQRLALLRPLSLAGIFAAVANLLLGAANALQAIGAPVPSDQTMPPAAVLLSEAFIPSFLGFAFLTVTWLCVAVAIRRAA